MGSESGTRTAVPISSGKISVPILRRQSGGGYNPAAGGGGDGFGGKGSGGSGGDGGVGLGGDGISGIMFRLENRFYCRGLP